MYRTDKIKLTPLNKEDLPLLYEWINNKELVHYNTQYKPIDYQSHEEWFGKIKNSKDMVIFAIRKSSGNKLIGTCQLHSISSVYRTAELQIRIGDEKEQQMGFGTDAVKLLVEYGFKDLNLRKIFIHVFSDNMRAINVYKNVGFVQEGLLKEHCFIDGKYKDILIMSIFQKQLF